MRNLIFNMLAITSLVMAIALPQAGQPGPKMQQPSSPIRRG